MARYDYMLIEICDREIFSAEKFSSLKSAREELFRMINQMLGTDRKTRWEDVEVVTSNHYRFVEDGGYALTFDWIIEKVPYGTGKRISYDYHSKRAIDWKFEE